MSKPPKNTSINADKPGAQVIEQAPQPAAENEPYISEATAAEMREGAAQLARVQKMLAMAEAEEAKAQSEAKE